MAAVTFSRGRPLAKDGEKMGKREKKKERANGGWYM